jgi:hypothetical protein
LESISGISATHAGPLLWDNRIKITWEPIMSLFKKEPVPGTDIDLPFGVPDHSIFDVLYWVLVCMIMSYKSTYLEQLITDIGLFNYEKYDIFFDKPKEKFTKTYSLQYWFSLLIGNLHWTVDQLYARSRNLPASWLKVKLEGSRSKSAQELQRFLIRVFDDALYDRSQFSEYAIDANQIVLVLAIMEVFEKNPDFSWQEARDAVRRATSDEVVAMATSLIAGLVDLGGQLCPNYNAFGEIVPLPAFNPAKDDFTAPEFVFERPRDDALNFFGKSLFPAAAIGGADGAAGGAAGV